MKESKKREMRIVFMGTPQFAVTILDHIVKKGYNVVGVITAPDKPAGRGRKINTSAVKDYALENNLNLLQPTNLKNESFLTQLKELNANLQVVVAFRMLPKVVWQMPEFGTFNLHASLLPEYRGAAPINWAIINGDKKTGVTTFFIDEKIDTGEIILQKEIKISSTENVGSLHDKLMVLGAKLVSKTIKKISLNKISTKPQPNKDLKEAPKLNKDNCQINWNQKIKKIYNHIRGLDPYPLAWTTLYNDKEEFQVKVYKAKKEKIKHNDTIGKIIFTKKELKVAAKNGYIHIEELKMQGKRKMDSISFLNGFTLSNNAFVK